MHQDLDGGRRSFGTVSVGVLTTRRGVNLKAQIIVYPSYCSCIEMSYDSRTQAGKKCQTKTSNIDSKLVTTVQQKIIKRLELIAIRYS